MRNHEKCTETVNSLKNMRKYDKMASKLLFI